MNTEEEIITVTMANGMKIITRYCPQWKVECMGVAVNAGSRDDDSQEEGMAHFVEHTLFKGTSSHGASYILNRMEAVGGELNAYTTKETTMVYCLAPKGNLSRGASLISDLIQNSIFPTIEINKERDVVADEIDSYLDMPSESIVDDFEELLYQGHRPLAHNILGTKTSLEKLDSTACQRFLASRYAPQNLVFFYSGPEKPDKVIKKAEKLFENHQATLPYERPLFSTPSIIKPELKILDKGLHQSHTVTGVLLPGIHDERKTALSLLTNMLGGPGMNSRLNVALREKRGMVYSVDAAMGMMSDTGIFSVYFGCDREDVKKCRTLAMNIIKDVAENGISPKALEAAKKQYSGQLTLASQNVENSTLAMARAALYWDHPHTVEQTLARIQNLSPDDIKEAAPLLHPDRFTTLTFL